MSEQEKVADIKEESNQVPAKRSMRKRVPFYTQKNYDYSQHKLDFKKYHYHWGLDRANNLQALFDGGYETVKENGKPVKRRGRNEEEYSYLLCIPLELYLEDQAGKLREPREVEESMRGGILKGNDKLRAEYTYSPKGGGISTEDQVGNSIVNRDTGAIRKINR